MASYGELADSRRGRQDGEHRKDEEMHMIDNKVNICVHYKSLDS